MAKQVKIDIVARDKTKQAIDSSKKSLSGLQKAAIAAGIAMATIGAVKGISGLVQVGKEIESLKIRFGFLFGTVEEGKKAFDNLAKFAGRVPFSLGEIAAASGNLAVVAKDANDLSKILEITGNVAAVTGLDFQTTASQIQRAFSGGIAAADVFREKGVRSLLGFSAGAKVSLEETVQAFEENFSGNGRFGQAANSLAGTLEGTLSMMGDKFMQFQMAINEGFFAEIKSQFSTLNVTLENNKTTWIAWGEAIGKGLAATISETSGILNLVTESVSALDRSLNTASEQSRTFGIVWDLINGYLITSQETFRGGSDVVDILTEKVIGLNQATAQSNRLNIENANSTMSKTMANNNAVIANDLLNESIRRGIDADVAKFKSLERNVLVERKSAEEKKKLGQDTFSQAKKMAAAGAAQSKKMFRLQQGLAIGETIMNTFTAASAALKQPPGPPFTLPLVALTVATGMAQVAGIRSQQPPAQFGGVRQQGSPFLVGEKGPELFTPSNAGTVTPNHQLGSGGATVNFNITTVDAQSFGNLLDTRRGQIVNMINTALNNKGEAALV